MKTPTPAPSHPTPAQADDALRATATEKAEQDLRARDDSAPIAAPRRAEDGGAATDNATETDAQPFVTFYIDKELFAFPMTSVREIIRMPEVVRIPMSAASLEGVANLRGQMLPVVNLRRAFHAADKPYGAATRVIVVEEGGLVGFIVDRVAMVISAGRDQMEPVSAIQLAVDSDLLAGLIKGIPGHAMVMLLDVPRLVRGQGRSLPRQDGAPGGDLAGPDGAQAQAQALTADQDSANERHLVSFMVADQEYAFPIDRVQEIVQVPAQLSQVPKAQSHVLGVMTLRNRLLPLVSLRQMFHLPCEVLSTEHRIVVIEFAADEHGQPSRRDGVVGIVMDAVNEVLRVPERLVDPLPAFLSSRHKGSEIEAICRLADGKRLVSILSVDKLFQHEALREVLHGPAEESAARSAGRKADRDLPQIDQSPDEGQADEEEQLVVFRLDGQEYGVGIESVQEIIRLPDSVTRVPKSVPSLVGVVNVRGQVLPVVDFRSRFGLGAVARDPRQRIVVLSLQGTHTGFVVDSVSEVLKVPRSTIDERRSTSLRAIDAVAAGSEQSAAGRPEGRLISRIANLQKQKRMILLLDTNSLLDRHEMAELSQLQAA